MTDAIIQVRDLAYRYPEATYPALDHVELEIAAGAFALVVGESGSGKSTLLRALNGLVPHFSGGTFGGSVTVAGLETRAHPPRVMSTKVGFVFQDPEAQLVTDRVDDEIAFALEQHGVTPVVMRKRVEEMLDVLGIAGLRERSPSTLSGGERQRVAVASALAMHPEVLVLDEPTSQLDPWGAEEVLAALRRLNEELGLTVVLAEHRLDRVLGHVDLVARVDRGKVMAGSPRTIVPSLDPLTLPPVTQLGLALEADPVPLTVKAGRALVRSFTQGAPPVRVASTPGDAIAELRGVQVAIDGHEILRDLSLTLRAGEVVAVMGRNGSGKSTLLRTILGFVPPRRGRVIVEGEDRTGKHPSVHKGAIGYVPQRPDAALFHDHLADEIRYSLRLRGVDGDVEAWLARFGLDGLGERHPRDLSGGERERAALAAILAGDPRLLLLDEPTRGMDARRKHEVMSLLRGMASEGKAVVLVTHDVELAARYADRVVLLGDREIIADGPPREVLVDSMTFTTQMNLLFGGEILTVEDALAAISASGAGAPGL